MNIVLRRNERAITTKKDEPSDIQSYRVKSSIRGNQINKDHWIKFTSNMDHDIYETQRRVDAHE